MGDRREEMVGWVVGEGGGGDLLGGVGMQLGVVGDELHNGVPDLLGGKVAGALNQQQAHVHKPLQIRIEPVSVS